MSNPLNQAAEVSQNGGDGGAELQSCSPLEVQHILRALRTARE